MGGKFNIQSFMVLGSLAGSLVTIGMTLGAGAANADCVTATGTASVACDGMLQSDMSGSTNGAVDGHGGGGAGQGVEDYDGFQGEVGGTELCGAMPGSVPRC